MLPVVASVNAFNFQTPLVNTTTPGTSVTRMPPDNVAPSLSSATVEDDLQGANQQQLAAANANNAKPNVQSAFIAQLAGQDDSPETQGLLVQYEKQIAISNVKYKPSLAFKPQPEPSSVFGRILQSEKTAPPQPHAEEPPAPETETTAPQLAKSSTIAAQQGSAITVAVTQPGLRGAKLSTGPRSDNSSAASAYAASIARISGSTGASIEVA